MNFRIKYELINFDHKNGELYVLVQLNRGFS